MVHSWKFLQVSCQPAVRCSWSKMDAQGSKPHSPDIRTSWSIVVSGGEENGRLKKGQLSHTHCPGCICMAGDWVCQLLWYGFLSHLHRVSLMEFNIISWVWGYFVVYFTKSVLVSCYHNRVMCCVILIGMGKTLRGPLRFCSPWCYRFLLWAISQVLRIYRKMLSIST